MDLVHLIAAMLHESGYIRCTLTTIADSEVGQSNLDNVVSIN